MASKRPAARLLLLAAIACCGPVLLSARAQDAEPAPSAASKASPNTPPDRPASRPGAERLRPQLQQRLQQQQQGEGARTPGWPFQPGRVGPNAAAPNDEEWQQTVRFLSEISPSRWQLFEQVTSKPHRADRVKRFLFARYSEMRELERSNPNLYDARVEQVKVEDEIFKIDSAMRDASPGEADPLRKQLGERVTDLVKKDLDQRELRLKQLQERLDREKDALENDRKRVDEIAERRTEALRRSSERFRAFAAGKPAPAENGPGNRPPRATPGDAPTVD